MNGIHSLVHRVLIVRLNSLNHDVGINSLTQGTILSSLSFRQVQDTGVTG